MPDTAPPNAELLRSLGRLVRGVSALFWSLPITLIICVQTAKIGMLHSFNILPCFLVTGWLFYGLWQLGYFQKQERIWASALDRAKVLALVNFGLSPFLFWYNQRPNEQWFAVAVGVMSFSGLLFLSSLNLVLCRLTAMLPDEGLREETRQFTTLNRFLLMGIIALAIVLMVLLRYPTASFAPVNLIMILASGEMWLWLLVFLSLLPLAMTMALLWKIKEVILDSVFGVGH